MLTKEEILLELKDMGIEVTYHTVEKNFPTTGKYTAYYASLIKDGEIIRKHFSRKSYDEALETLYTIFTLNAKLENKIEKIRMTKIHFGTAGWSFKDWVPNFYPKTQSGNFDWLQYYSSYFNCVEVNSSYYAYIDPKVVRGWIEKVSDVDDFTFTIKLHQDFTHKKDYDNNKINAVTHNLEMLRKADRFGGLLIQFPYSFSFNEPNTNHVKKIKEIFDGFQCFIEVRHKSWFNKKAIELLNYLDLGYTTIDQPIIGEAIPFELITINNKAYVRFHGRNKEAWSQSINNFGKPQTYQEQNARYDYLYSPGELIELQQKIEPLLASLKEIFIIFNNHPKGQAAANTFEMMNLLGRKQVEIPTNILTAFPRLSRIALTQPSAQPKTEPGDTYDLFG
jgi:uncharacterized protein YecE (DUF72 family)